MIRKIRTGGSLRAATPNQTIKPKNQAKPELQKKNISEATEDQFEKATPSRRRFGEGQRIGLRARDGVDGRRFERRRGAFLRKLLGISPQTRPRPNPSPSPQPPVNSVPLTKPNPIPNRSPNPNVNPHPQPPVEVPTPTPGPVPPPVTDKLSGMQILTGWKQGSTGNCVTVAAIKAAQTRFGPELANAEDPSRGIFKSAVRTDSGGIKIEMRDGFKCSVTKSELEYARKSSRFRLYKSDDKSLLKNAQEVYAIAAKRAQIQGNDGYGPNRMNYSKACSTLNNGENTQSVAEQLGRVGLKDHTTRVKRGDLKNYKAALTYTPGHAYFVTEGKRDYYGKSGGLGRGGSYGWVLSPPKEKP